MTVLHEVAHFLRWRVIAFRYAGKLRALSPRSLFREPAHRTAIAQRVRRQGHDRGPRLPADSLESISQIYRPRAARVIARETGHPFVNLFQEEDISADNPVLRHVFSPDVLDIASDYFSGRFIIDSIQVLYSWPTSGALRESQKWHKDYGDSKSFHWIAYLNDVLTPDDGPFVFTDRIDTRRIARSPFIRRIGDKQFLSELRGGRTRQFLGPAGETIFVDPAVCYHYGSRCKNPRLTIFATFNTHRPFVQPMSFVREHRRRIFDAAQRIRPDLADSFIAGILQLRGS